MYRQLAMEFETWKPVSGYEALYDVSDQGRVRRSYLAPGKRGGDLLHTSPVRCGYLRVRLCKNNVATTYMVHSLVAAVFIGQRPDGLVINHKDGNKLNNHPSNLEYVTYSQNSMHGMHVLGVIEKLPRGESKWNAKLSDAKVREIRALHAIGKYGYQQLADKYGVTHACISMVCRGVTWQHVAEAA